MESDIQQEKLKSVYFGGGTPTTLTPVQIDKILQSLKKRFGFEEDIEINLETTPENVTRESMQAWKNIGVNRISMGIQSLNDRALSEIKRQGSQEIFRALGVLQEGIIENISVDFIIGLPFVEKGELLKYIQQILRKYTVIQHVSVYMLEDYYEVPDEKDSKFQNVVYPVNWSKDGITEEAFLDEYLSIRKYLASK